MKTNTLLAIAVVLVLILHATFTPIIITDHLNKTEIDYTTHYAKGDSINYELIQTINAENYEK